MLGLQDSVGWFGVDDLVWLAVLFIFLAAIASVFVQRLRKDKCLALLNDHHVTYLNETGKPLWGDLRVSSQGLELLYDAPYTTARGLVKTSCLLYPAELSGCVAICRSVRGLTDQGLQALGIAEARGFDQNAIIALALDAGFCRTQFVDASFDDLNRLLNDAAEYVLIEIA